MAKRLPYSAWARLELEKYPEDQRAGLRSSYFSDNAKAHRYDTYRAYCKANRYEWDAPNEEYWELKKRPWHTPAGIATGLAGVLVWLLLGLIGGTTTRR